MADQLQVGLTFEKTITVTENHAARHLAGKGIRVFSTPEMVRLMEECALEAVLPYLQPNQDTVGIRVEMRHLAATPMGMKVTARCTLVEIDRRRLVFKAEIHDEMEKVGEGMNERFIVDKEKHEQRIAEKVARWKPPA
ncbi:MAG: thioesterase family protein [Candidatus Methylomirabilota bacterium]|jgi:predicted thioesterase